MISVSLRFGGFFGIGVVTVENKIVINENNVNRKVVIENKKCFNHRMNNEELTALIEKHEKNASQIAEDIGVSRSAMSNWMSGKRGIGDVEAKLLRLYFYGEMPFDLIGRPGANTNELRFTTSEWQVIAILANREGFQSPVSWITGKIRGYLDNNATAQELGQEVRSKKNKSPGRSVSYIRDAPRDGLLSEPEADFNAEDDSR